MPKHEAMDIETVADLLKGVSTRQIRTYVSQYGMPMRKEGRTPVFPWYDVLDWYVGYRAALEAGDRPNGDGEELELDEEGGEIKYPSSKNEDIRAVHLRRARADASLKELALSRQNGEVVTIADAKVRLDRLMGNLRSKLLSMAPKVASRLEGLKERTEREAAIKDELEILCREISTGAVVDVPHDNGGENLTTVENLAASAESDGLTDHDILRNVAELLQEGGYAEDAE